MPVENELKYILPLDFDAARLGGWQRRDIRQAYLDDGPRIRQIDQDYLFTYKRWIAATRELLEIEVALSVEDFALLWPLCVERIRKTRYVKKVGAAEWVVDFLMQDDDRVYFVLAEVEMPRHQVRPDELPAEIGAHVLHLAEAGDSRFTNRKLSNVDYAAALYREIANRGGPSR